MRPLLFLILFCSIVPLLPAQDKNRTIEDGETGKSMLVGLCTREAFSDTAFSGWFDSNYNDYNPDTVTLKEIEYNIDNAKTTIVMGTWCSDSRDQVPHFFKIMDEADYPDSNITMICVNREKEGLSGDVDSLNIELVPTFIFYRNDKEIGRIIETPRQTMEEDIYEILQDGKE